MKCFIVIKANERAAPVSNEEAEDILFKNAVRDKRFAALPNYSAGFQGWLDSVSKSQFTKN